MISINRQLKSVNFELDTTLNTKPETKNRLYKMEPVTEMLMYVLVPSFFIASTVFLVYVYCIEEKDHKE